MHCKLTQESKIQRNYSSKGIPARKLTRVMVKLLFHFIFVFNDGEVEVNSKDGISSGGLLYPRLPYLMIAVAIVNTIFYFQFQQIYIIFFTKSYLLLGNLLLFTFTIGMETLEKNEKGGEKKDES